MRVHVSTNRQGLVCGFLPGLSPSPVVSAPCSYQMSRSGQLSLGGRLPCCQPPLRLGLSVQSTVGPSSRALLDSKENVLSSHIWQHQSGCLWSLVAAGCLLPSPQPSSLLAPAIVMTLVQAAQTQCCSSCQCSAPALQGSTGAARGLSCKHDAAMHHLIAKSNCRLQPTTFTSRAASSPPTGTCMNSNGLPLCSLEKT